MKDAYYFSHDANARSDPKVMAMLSRYGAEGYGWYWMLIEKLREQRTFRLPINGQYSAAVYSRELYCDPEKACKFIHDCIEEFHLFESDGKEFWAESLIRRMEYMEKRRAQWRDGQKTHRNVSTKNVVDINSVSTGKESKVKGKEINTYVGEQDAPSPTKDGIPHDDSKKGIIENTTGATTKNATDKDSVIQNPAIETQSQFEEFWKKYPAPRRANKKGALKSWSKIGVTQDVFNEIMDGLARHLASPQWKKNGGQFIPLICTFLNQERWKVELEPVKKSWSDF